MTVLLPVSGIQLFAPDGAEDPHGWAMSDETVLMWSGLGNVQEGRGDGDAAASEAGGSGPYDPATHEVARLFVPLDAAALPGWLAYVDSETRPWLLVSVRYSRDPTGTRMLDCLVCEMTRSKEVPQRGQ